MQKKEPLVSILLPCYNAETYIATALASIIQQHYTNLEIIVIDDHSNDGTLVVLQRLADCDQRIRLFKNVQNLGLIKTLNIGLKLAKGDYVARMDADDICHPNRIRKQISFLQKNPQYDMVSTCAYVISARGKVLGAMGNHGCYDSNSSAFLCFWDNPFIHPSVMIKRSVITQYFYSDKEEALHVEDYYLWLKLIEAGYRIRILPEKLLNYRINPVGVSQSNSLMQAGRSLKLAADYLRKSIDVDVDLQSLSVLRQDVSGLSNRNALNEAFTFLDEVATRFIEHTSEIEEKERQRIHFWISERKLRVIWLTLIKSKVPLTSKIHLFLLVLPKYLFKKPMSRSVYNLINKGRFTFLWRLCK